MFEDFFNEIANNSIECRKFWNGQILELLYREYKVVNDNQLSLAIPCSRQFLCLVRKGVRCFSAVLINKIIKERKLCKNAIRLLEFYFCVSHLVSFYFDNTDV